MATIDYWIQLENRPWDASPHNIDRITGEDMKEVTGKDPVERHPQLARYRSHEDAENV